MNRWAVIGILGGSVLAAPLACQSPDAFLRPAGGSAGGAGGRASGAGGSGLGGFFGVGGSFGTGGRGTGGNVGVGGATGTGGRGTGGIGSAGTNGTAGTTGAAGSTGTAGAPGTAGMTGAGGRIVDAGSGCVATLINNGYAAGTAVPCSMCRENSISRAQLCMDIIDCIAPLYPCTGCFTDCSNKNGGSGPVMDCVNALVAAACTN